jgi:hypothetical protein
MVFRSRRFIEYFPAFALLFAGVSWGRGQFSLSNWLPERFRFRVLIPLGMAAIVGVFAYSVIAQVYQDAKNARPPEYLAGASSWLRDHAPDGAMVFQTDWDDFTRLFYYNTRSTYLVGLDPTYLQIADSKLWDEWVDITQGKVKELSQVIPSRFSAAYVVSDKQHDQFIERANQDPNLQLVYQDQYNYVWHISGAEIASAGD